MYLVGSQTLVVVRYAVHRSSAGLISVRKTVIGQGNARMQTSLVRKPVERARVFAITLALNNVMLLTPVRRRRHARP